MSTTIPDHTDLAVDRTRRMGGAAVATAATAVTAGLGLLVVDPTSGSRLEAMLGFTAAASGLLTALLVVVAVVYAQIKGLWTRVPVQGRYVLWALLAIAIANSISSQISQLR